MTRDIKQTKLNNVKNKSKYEWIKLACVKFVYFFVQFTFYSDFTHCWVFLK